MSTVKDLNSILSEIFCNVQITNRSFKTGKPEQVSRDGSFWSVDESAILPGSEAAESRRPDLKKSRLVKETVNKNILLKKFRPINFISGFQSKLTNDKKVPSPDPLNQKEMSKFDVAAFNKKSREYKEIISNSRSPSKNITKSFGVKNKSSRVSRREGPASPNQFASNYSKSSWNKKKTSAKSKQKRKHKKQFEKIQVRPK